MEAYTTLRTTIYVSLLKASFYKMLDFCMFKTVVKISQSNFNKSTVTAVGFSEQEQTDNKKD